MILSNLITRSGNERYNVKTFQTLSYFNSILVSVLKLLERDSFAARTKQEKVQFLRGLHKMLPQFSPALQRRKLLPSVRGMLTQMTEIMADRSLLPYILPNVFAMASNICTWRASHSLAGVLQQHFTADQATLPNQGPAAEPKYAAH